jgi:hypothetical protein
MYIIYLGKKRYPYEMTIGYWIACMDQLEQRWREVGHFESFQNVFDVVWLGKMNGSWTVVASNADESVCR